MERSQVLRSDGRCGRQRERQGVARLSGDPELVMQMGARGPACLPDKTNGVVLRHACATPHGDAAQVCIYGGVLPVVAKHDYVAVPPPRTGIFNDSVCYGANTSAGRRRVVDSFVGAPVLHERMHAHPESGAHPGKLERRAKKRLAEVLAIGSVVPLAESHGAVSLPL